MDEKVGRIVQWLDEKKGQDIVVLEVAALTPLCDAMVLVTALSARHAQALAEELGLHFREQGWPVLGVEGLAVGQWVLVDGGDVVVHVFVDEIRQRYDLEGLYARARRVAWARPEAGASADSGISGTSGAGPLSVP